MKNKAFMYFCFTFILWCGGCVSTQQSTTPLPSAQLPPTPPQELFYSAQVHGQSIEKNKAMPSGSLWNPLSESLFKDIKAHKIGDIITITISEEADASGEAETETERTHNWTGNLSASNAAIGGKNLLGGSSSFSYGAEFGRGHKGSGRTSRTNSVTAYMSATVIDVLPNGNLVIRGSRWIKVNDEMHQIVLEGVVRPVDIMRDNAVLSQKIADAKIFVVGKGPLSRQQKPGWLGQIIDLLFPL